MMYVKDKFGWKKCFALVPFPLGDKWVWFRTYWTRFYGEYYETSLGNPNLGREISDGFNGNNLHLCGSIDALLKLNRKDAVSHRIPGMAVQLLEVASKRLRRGTEL